MTQTDQAIADAIAASIEGTDGRFSIEVEIGEGKVAEVSGRYETEGYSEDDRLSGTGAWITTAVRVRVDECRVYEALRCAWANMKLKAEMRRRIVKFYFQKVDGSAREAFGTLNDALMPPAHDADGRKKNDTVQVYFDTERGAYRCFKKANLIRIAR